MSDIRHDPRTDPRTADPRPDPRPERTDGATKHELANKLNREAAEADSLAHEPSYVNVSPNSPARISAAGAVDIDQMVFSLKGIQPGAPAVRAYVYANAARYQAALGKAKALGATDEQLAPLQAEIDASTRASDLIANAIVAVP